ncbi:hypothetical protein R84981_001404 [Carnimonas sp. R-84981]|uniref:hypothetical protein n=1 Tax=Carnimonas bestiolae TaxID=3402172 RepID=UPI003EDBBCC5
MGQLIKSRFGKFLGKDTVTGKLKLCGPADFSEWIFLKDGTLLTHADAIIDIVDEELTVATVRRAKKRKSKISVETVDGGIALLLNGRYVSDRKGKRLGLVDERKAWEIFAPQ